MRTLTTLRDADLSTVAWSEVVHELVFRGWTRLEGAVAPPALEALKHAAAGPWSALPETETAGGVIAVLTIEGQAVFPQQGRLRSPLLLLTFPTPTLVPTRR